ncbi:MAG: hypothetical protein O3A92_14840 [Verrucomicrobia bacterium]|nr:hypothetical protein [Verrucomicrobiota bacterium]
MVHLQKFHERYAADGLFVYTIAMLEERDKVQEITRELAVTFPIFWGVGSELGDRFAFG